MDLQHNYTAEEVLKIVNTMPPNEKENLKNLILNEEADFENLVKENFIKYEATFKALA